MSEGAVPGTNSGAQETADVMIVDDEAQARALLRAALRGVARPCRIREAADGDSAMKMAEQSRPDLVLLDILLPGSSVTGVLLCQKLCKDSRTRVVIVSGRATDSVVDTCLAMGAIEHIRKPFSVDVLREKLERWLAA
jgi:CheY-like chemotaxis protein